MEGKPDEKEVIPKDDDEQIDVVSEESFSEESSDEDNEIESEEGRSQLEAPLTEEEIEELIADLLEVESKAAEAQETLEKESLEKVEREVREELAVNLQGDDLEKAVKDEMEAFRGEWEETLDELEADSAHLLEQLDGAGIDLPSIYKWIESKAPNGCCTEAWKKRTHWVGSEIAGEAVESIKEAEMQLQTVRPVRKKHGKILEEGASGYLGKKIAAEDRGEGLTKNVDVDWSSFNKVFTEGSSKEVAFGSKQWASVYLASTPQQAAALGLQFPGVDEVEEIDDIDDDSSDPFVADAIANEKELELSEVQKKNYRKVKEEDDMSVDQKLQLQLKRRRRKKRSKQNVRGNTREDLNASGEPFDDAVSEGRHYDDGSSDLTQGVKRSHDNELMDPGAKKARTCINESSDKAETFTDNINEDVVQPINVEPVSQKLGKKFYCTGCGNLTNIVHQHPLMKVIACELCKCTIEKKMKDIDCTECYCGWCGRNEDLVNCISCQLHFCKSCIKRNLGEGCLSEAKPYEWRCCCCSADRLQQLTLDLEEAIGSKDSTSSSSDSDTDISDDDVGISASGSKSKKKKIRRIIDDTELGEETKRKIAMEKERQERLKSLKAQFSGIPMMMDDASRNGSLPEDASSEVLGDASTGFIVNVVREEGEDAVRIPPSISAKLKTHQVAGIRFMWENIIQSIRNVKIGDKGLGCILAHTMGLGKTFQVIAFLYTAMRSVDLGLRTAMIVVPVNVLHNWRQEFKKWEPSELQPLRVYMLEDKPREQRAELLMKWRKKGGVFLIGYNSFRNLSLAKNVKSHEATKICCALQEGPDILVCDEAHMIKNTMAETTQALKQVKCQRRIALTGSPLQNNLMEYYCMVDFVREGFLGSMHEFRNRFQNPIENGQHANSTAEDVRIMNQRSHILYEQLKGFVQRMDMSVVKKDLPPKTVFVISVKLSSLQRKLYKKFLDAHGFTNLKSSCDGVKKNHCFAGYQALAQICNHPWILQLMKERQYGKREDVVDNFFPDASSSDENMDFNAVNGDKAKMESTSSKSVRSFLHEGWWDNILNQHNHQDIDYSGKMVLLLDILTKSTEVGDKALVFSQSLATLDLIEIYLSRLPRLGKMGKHWKQGKDWYRIDGKTKGSERQRLIDLFNSPQNGRVKCTLISTRAGALGINLFAANRVIIVDGSWNPTHDLQAIFRAWRYGQKKPVYAYRLVAQGTIEEKIYKRQVQKEGLAARVVDRQQVHRSMSKEEMLHLFDFGDDENLDMLTELLDENANASSTDNSRKDGYLMKPNASDCPKSCSSDKLMAILLKRHRLRWIMNFHEHETLLQENEDEKLTKEEQDLAWEGFKRSMESRRVPEWEEVRRVPAHNTPNAPSIIHEPSLRAEPRAPPEASTAESVANVVNKMRNRLHVRKCTGIAHMLILRSGGIKIGCSTVCGECGQEISWESLDTQ
ncbi:protein CHROMATIN REMODELING 20 isoform X2 [Silene latifolia]|uniref:protein CHROMATIN REMODELING 20 isoform X2 n=1 Tax=Silene latifolia TaxID=37657 RepID=UPI003D7785F2